MAQVLVRYFAGAAAAAGAEEERLEVPDGASAADLVALLAARHPAAAAVLEVASLLVDEVAVRDRSLPWRGPRARRPRSTCCRPSPAADPPPAVIMDFRRTSLR